MLRNYLQKLTYKVGWDGGTINYVDGFAGPWRSSDKDFRDTSPLIAIDQFRNVRDDLQQLHRPHLTIRCLFVEKDSIAADTLKSILVGFDDFESEVLIGEFESRIEDVLQFLRMCRRPFGFLFIDPTGWTGFGMRAITPLLRHSPGEVLINFMTKDIIRFIDDSRSSIRSTFEDLFGTTDHRDYWAGLNGQLREDAIVAAYVDRVRTVGGFDYVASSVIANPTLDRTHYHLIYASRVSSQ